MGFSDWNLQYAVNHPLLDKQHELFFNLINELHAAIFAKTSKYLLAKTIQALHDYKRYFAEEEQLMRQQNYPGYFRHKAEHDRLIGRVHEYEQQLHAGDTSFSPEIFQFMVSDWLSKHILGTDKEYAYHLVKAPALVANIQMAMLRDIGSHGVAMTNCI